MSCSLDKGRVKICILTSVHPPFDVRIFHKQAKTLIKAGYGVVLIAQHTKEETVDGVKIVPLPKAKHRFERMTKVVWKLFRLALKEKANVYHFHDPELILIGVGLKLLGKKVIYDVHEDVPKDILAKDWAGNFMIRKTISFIFDGLERFSSVFFDSVISATPDIAKKFNPTKTILLRNMPILELIDTVKPASRKRDKSIVIYAGGLSRVRGIKEIIQAMELVKAKAELWLLGKWKSEEFKKQCEILEGWEYTKYLGYKEIEHVYSYMKNANIGIVNFLPQPHNINSLPNKPFEYMACSVPIVMSNFPYWEEMFKGCAIFCNSQEPRDIAKKIDFLLAHPQEAERIGRSGRQVILEKYNWENESKKLIKMYQDLLK